jgi:inner membrane protein
MDNLTHTLIGVAVANSGLRRKFGRGTVIALAIASNIPDIDVFWGFVHHGPSFAYRRMLTHGVLGIPALAALCAMVHRRFFPHVSFRNWFLLYLLGAVLHVGFDLANSYGVVVLYPFSRHRFELAWLFIIDLALWFFLIAPLVVSRVRSPWTSFGDLSRVAVRCVMVYVAACALLHFRSEMAMNGFAVEAGMKPTFSYVFPEALGPQRFRGVLREGDTWRIYRIDSIPGTLVDFAQVKTQDGDPDVKKILETKEGRWIAWFAKAPVWKPVEGAPEGGRRWSVRDLRFGSTVINRGNPFVYGFDVVGDSVTFLGRIPAEKEAA